VDQYYNADLNYNLIPPVDTAPQEMNPHPGTDGEIYGVELMANDEAIVVGDFFTYDQVARNCIALVKTNGLLDASFNPGSGANDFINCVGVDSNGKVIIGGAFTSFNGTQRNGVARLNSNGSLDTTFNPGAGANGTVRTLNVLTDGRVVIGGDFTTYNGITRNHIARLNTDGSLDTTFNPGNEINNSVYALAHKNDTTINVNVGSSGGQARNDNVINVGAPAGVLTVDYDMLGQPDDMKVYYGVSTNGGIQIFDTGFVSFTGHLVIPFGPTNGLSFNQITIVMNETNGQFGTLWSYTASVSVQGASELTIGGAFTSVGGIGGQDHIARLLFDGSVDGTFDPGGGANGVVRALAMQDDGSVLVGGEFTGINGQSLNRIARLTDSGLVDASFFGGYGADDTVYTINYKSDGLTTTNIYVGGAFTSINGTHRLGFARLNSDGTVDTSFLDMAYNQFAGLTRQYFGDSHGTVLSSRVQSNGGVLIGGAFTQVGGGQFDMNVRSNSYYTTGLSQDTDQSFVSSDVWREPKVRDGVRSRNNFARLIGGATDGPGNVGLLFDTDSVNKSQPYTYVSLVRANGSLGPAAVNFAIVPGTAQCGSDYAYYSADPMYWMDWEYAGPSRCHIDGWFGTNGLVQDTFGNFWLDSQSRVFVSILNNQGSAGDLSARFNLANPVNADQFYLGGQDMPIGVALGRSTAPLTIIDDHHASGVLGFVSPVYVGVSNTPITLQRTNGTYGVVSLNFATTVVGSTAILNSDYRATNGTVTFNGGQTNNSFGVIVLQSNYITSVEKFVNMVLYNPQGPLNGVVSLGQTNAVLRIINANYQGYLNLSTNSYNANLSSGYASVTVTRTVGSKGTLTVLCATTNDTALSGVDYVGTANVLTWNNGDVSPRTVNIPLLNNSLVGPAKQFKVVISNPTLNTNLTPSLFAATAVTNATVTINNDNSYGAYQFSSPMYVVNETGGYATLTVNRTGSSLGSASVDYTTADAGAVSGVNYTTTAGTLNFTNGQLSASITVPVMDDQVADPAPDSFYFTVTLANPSAGAALGSPVSANVEIVDTGVNGTFNHPPGGADSTFNTGSGMNSSVLALALQSNGSIIAGGNFTTVNGTPENYLARLNPDGSLDSAGFLYGNLAANGPVYAVVSQTDDHVLVGGNFTSVNGVTLNHIARLSTDGLIDTSFNPGAGADNIVYALAETFIGGNRKLYAAGAFNNINAVASRGIARLNNNGTVDTGFTVGAGASDAVYALAVYPTNSSYAGKLLIGGAFATVNNISLPHVARLNVDGSVDTNFNLGLSADGNVHAIAIQDDGKVVIGGDFTHVNGVSAAHIARLNVDGSVDTDFAANVNGGFDGPVSTINLQTDNRIVVGGDFTHGNGVTRHRLSRLMPDGKVDPTINFGDGANASINAMVIQPGDAAVIIGGAFTQYDGATHQHIARIYGGSQTGSGNFQFTSYDHPVNENDVYASINVRRTGGTSGPNPDGSGDVTVHFSTSDGTALAGVNYGSVDVDVSFPPGETLKSVLVPVIDDQMITDTLTNYLALSDPSAPAGLGDQSTGAMQINNVDGAVSFSSATYSVPMNTLQGFGTINVVRIGTAIGSCSVDLVTTTNGTALAGTDFISPTNTTISFNPGETNKAINIQIFTNNLAQGNKTIIFALSNAVNTVLSAPTNATLTIIDTVNAPGVLAMAAPTYTVGEGDTNAYVTVIRTNGSSGIVTVNYNTLPGTAVNGVNYSTSSGTLTFGDGVSSQTIVVPLVDNNLVQGPVSFNVSIAGASGGATLSAATNSTVTILDNDAGILFAAATNSAAEDSGYATVNILRLYNTSGTSSVHFATVDGTAVAGINYSNLSGEVDFDVGETLKSVSIPIINNTNVTGDLAFVVNLSSPSGAQLAAPSNTVVVIQDLQAGVSFTNSSMRVLKNIGLATITVVCSNPGVEPVILSTNDIPLSVNYTTADGTALAGVDYQPVNGVLVFTNGIATNTFTVPIYNNNLVTGDRTFSVILTNVTAPGQITPYGTQAVVIAESNAGLQFSQSNYKVFKNGVTATINVLRTGYTNSVASVNFLATNGTALNGVNFVATNGTLVFSNGVISKSFNVALIANSLVQPNLIAQLQLSNPTNGLLQTPSAATLTILENGGSYVIPAGAQVVTNYTSHKADGIINSNDTVQVWFGLRDSAGLDVTNLVATLLTTNGVTPSAPTSQTYGPLKVYGHSVSRPFTFTAFGTNSFTISPTFALYDNAKPIGTATFTFSIGTWTNRFFGTNYISINDFTNASPYPSVISVSGVGHTLVKSTVTLTNLSHTYPQDVDALTVSPSQKSTLIMSLAGASYTVNHITVTFDDAASNSLPFSSVITNGVYKPTALSPVVNFP
jgi:uncharacterized delta-60 repeat protein